MAQHVCLAIGDATGVRLQFERVGLPGVPEQEIRHARDDAKALHDFRFYGHPVPAVRHVDRDQAVDAARPEVVDDGLLNHLLGTRHSGGKRNLQIVAPDVAPELLQVQHTLIRF
jgi:hypothetical protein